MITWGKTKSQIRGCRIQSRVCQDHCMKHRRKKKLPTCMKLCLFLVLPVYQNHREAQLIKQILADFVSTYYQLLPVLVLPDSEPFDQILGALQFGMKTIFLPFEPSHVFHRHTAKQAMGKGKTNNKTDVRN